MKSEEGEYQTYANEFHEYTTWFVKYVKNEKEKNLASYNNVLNELKTEKKARERLQNDLVGEQNKITELMKEIESLKAELKAEREKKMGQKSQKNVKCCCCDAESKFKFKDMMVCSVKCAKEAKPTVK